MRTKHLLSIAAVAVTLLQASAVELTFSFSTNNGAPLYDISGTWETNVDNMHQVFSLTVSPRGRISGPMTATYDDGVAHLDFQGTTTGVLAAYGMNPHLTLVGHAHFSGTFQGVAVRGTETMRQTLRPDAARQNLTGRETVTVCVVRYGCQTSGSPVSIPFADSPETSDGAWTLTMTLGDTTPRMTGTAVATLAKGRTVNFTVRGTYSARRHATSLWLTGTDDARGVVLTGQLDSGNELVALKGRLFGQQILVQY